MDIKVKKTKKNVTITIADDIGVVHASEFLARINENLDRAITVDMTGVGLIDTSFVQVILAAKEAASDRNGAIHLVRPPRMLVDMLVQSCLADRLSIN